jgi:segregation and condensation protein A
MSLAAPMPSFRVPTFEGPLDLLLHLIRANQVDISDIPIAEITNQYLAMMNLFEEMDLQAAGEYVLLAATLIEIKSRMLLPQPPPQPGDEAEDPRAELVARLREYEEYQGTVETFRIWEEARRAIYFRGAAEATDDYVLPIAAGEATPLQLYHALHRLLAEAGVDDRPVTAVIPRRRLSLRLKMAEILRKVNASGTDGLSFEQLFALPCPRYDIVLTFLAMLELLRLIRVRAKQAGLYAGIKLFGTVEGAVAAR